MSDEQAITVVNTESYGHGNNVHHRGTMQVEYILDIVPGAWHQPEDLVTWLTDHPYITSVTYTGEGGPTKLEQLKKVFDDAYELAYQTGYDCYINKFPERSNSLNEAYIDACEQRNSAFDAYDNMLNNG
jgi:hypothetical protein